MTRQSRAKVTDPPVVRALSLLVEMARVRRGVLFGAFAEKRGYPLRAVYRAKDVLTRAGAPIRKNPESPSRWQLADGWLPPALIGAARDELIALFVARHIAPGLRGTPVGRSLDNLWTKLTSVGPQQQLDLEDPSMPFSIRSAAAIDYGRHRLTIERLRDAIENGYAVQMRYRSADNTISDRVVEPGFLHWDGGLEAMYVPSWCRMRHAIRVFAVHRILQVDPLPTEPARSRPARRMMERAFRVWYRDHVEHVELWFAPRVAAELRERTWHASQRFVEEPGGAVRLHLDIAAPEELRRWLLGFGPDVRIVAPTRLADLVRRSHAQAAQLGALPVMAPLPKPTVRSGASPLRKRARSGT